MALVDLLPTSPKEDPLAAKKHPITLIERAHERHSTKLDLSGCSLKKPPSTRHNRLKTWPPVLMKLRHLSALGLERNQIAIIPTSVAQLSRLKAVDVSSNKI